MGKDTLFSAGAVDARAESAVVNAPCPWLPDPSIPQRIATPARQDGGAFYTHCLRRAQLHWIEGKPAQAILQLNKAWSADLAPDEEALLDHPPPYAALAWLLKAASSGEKGFLGNPVRHFQHLATRVTGPNRTERSWRAWVCYHIARKSLPDAGFGPDGRQWAREGIWIPGPATSLARLENHGWPGEAGLAATILRQAS